jgi:hypothetical protein
MTSTRSSRPPITSVPNGPLTMGLLHPGRSAFLLQVVVWGWKATAEMAAAVAAAAVAAGVWWSKRVAANRRDAIPESDEQEVDREPVLD